MSIKRSFKRPFQPSITSYFGHVRDTDCHPATTQTSTLSPILPATIQSSLLNVGMRVRKSVPDGYKTRQKTFCDLSKPFGASTSKSDQTRSTSTGFNGLLPYCGILKVGGYESQQPVPEEADLPPLQSDHDAWAFPSSQESNVSTVSNSSLIAPAYVPIATISSNKRRREDADEEDLDLESQPVSPRSRPISHTRMPNLNDIRPIALPKSRRKVSQPEEIGESEMVDVGDFGEAEFLRPAEWVEGEEASAACEAVYFPT